MISAKIQRSLEKLVNGERLENLSFDLFIRIILYLWKTVIIDGLVFYIFGIIICIGVMC